MGGPESDRVTHVCHFTGRKGKQPGFKLPVEDVGLCHWKPGVCAEGSRVSKLERILYDGALLRSP